MKKSVLNLFAVLGLSVSLFAFTTITGGGIKGTIAQADGADAVLAVQGTDTLKAQPNQGAFEFKDLKAGTYTVIVKAKAPLQDATVENVAVNDSTATDVGIIQLK